MRIHTHRSELWLPRPRAQVFSFFADAHNLERLTPPILRFRVLTPAPIPMHAGALIDYRLRFRGVPLRWRTRIAQWDPNERFVDEQVRGPYRLWRHAHTFEDRDGGTLCRDQVEYAYFGSALLQRWFVSRDIARIFEFRARALRAVFPAVPSTHATSE